MEFNFVHTLEQHVNLTLQGYLGQVRILSSLGPHPERAQHIENLRRMVVALSVLVEKDKKEVINEVDSFYSKIASMVAEQQEQLTNLAKETGEPEIIEVSEFLTKARPKTINMLGLSEAKTEEKILRRFNAMLKNIQDVLTIVENIRR